MTTPFDRIVAAIKASGTAESTACMGAGLDRSALSNARRKAGRLDLSTIEKFATYLNVPLTELLGETAPAAPAAPADPSLRRIPFLLLTRSHLNPRRTFDAEAIAELAESIAVQGLLQNLVVRKDDEQEIYWIVAGERRYRAIEELFRQDRAPEDLKGGIPCKVIEANDAQHLALALLENLQRVDVNPMEEASAFAQLMALDPAKWTTRAIAEAIGKPADRSGMRFVQQRLALVEKLAPEAQAALREGKISFSQARVLTMATPARQAELVKQTKRYATADALRVEIVPQQIPVDQALFDLATYDGLIIEDPDTGARRFADKDTFKAAQKAAIPAKLDELRRSWAWAESVDWFSECDYDTSDDPTVAGAVVCFREWNCETTIHTGLVKRRNVAARSDDKVHKARQELLGRRQQAMTEWRDELAAVLTPMDAVALILFCQVASDQYGNAPSGVLKNSGGMAKALVHGGPLAKLSPAMVKQTYGAADRLRLKDGFDPVAAWTVIRGLDGEAAGQLLSAVVAGGLGGGWHKPPHPVLVDLSERHGIAVPAELLVDDKTFEEAVKVRAKELREAPPEAPDSVAARVRKALRQTLAMASDDPGLPENHEEFAGDLDMMTAHAVDLAQRLHAEFDLDQLPFKADPDTDFGLPELGLETVGALIAYMEKRLAGTARRAAE